MNEVDTRPLSGQLADKSVLAAVSAIEVYNKPTFNYREEAFSLLMVNAWELLLKAKWLSDRKEEISALYELEGSGGAAKPRLNRCGNPITHGVPFLAARLIEDKSSGLEKGSHDNLLALIEIRDNAAHFLNKDEFFARRVLEVGTAALRNYLSLAERWFKLDLSAYNFFLMPISFYHGFEAVTPATFANYPKQVQHLLTYLDQLENSQPNPDSQSQHFALRLETKLVRGKDAAAVPFRWTADPSAAAILLRDEDVLANYPLTYRDLATQCQARYANFLVNDKFHKLRQALDDNRKYAIVRFLNPKNPRGGSKVLYNPNVFQELDKHYKRRGKT